MIEIYFEGEVDFIIYSIVSGMCCKFRSEKVDFEFWWFVIKLIGEVVFGVIFLFENDMWIEIIL